MLEPNKIYLGDCIEKDPEYHRKSVERYNKHIQQLKLL